MASLNPNQHHQINENQFKKENFEATKWKDLGYSQKFLKILGGFIIALKVFLLVYGFMCGVDILTTSFKLIAGKNINGLTSSETLSNPIVGLIVGVFVTILVQSSSTATAIIVSLVSSKIIDIKQAIPMIFGSNIGTSVTSTFVSFAQVSDRDSFERAFAGATIHDIFNYLSVITLLSVEIITRNIPGSKGMIEYITELAVNAIYQNSNSNESSSTSQPGLKTIITPITSKIIKINKKILTCWAENKSENVTTIIERYCDVKQNKTICPTHNSNGTVPCCFIFSGSQLSDQAIGIILLICALAILIVCLITIVRVLNSVLKGSVQTIVKKYVNSDLPYVPYLTGYIALIVGALLTVIMQSSSIFTSLLTPLIGMGVVSLERCYPLTLGSNIGTTTTALLAALTESTKESIQIALVHFVFNILGILIFFPLPFMRFPIPIARALGKITAKYRWVAILYIVSMFLVLPTVLFLISKCGTIAISIFLLMAFILLSAVTIINQLQSKCPQYLPPMLETWNFLPKPLRSLEPYDNVISSAFSCCLPGKSEELPKELPQMVLTPSRRYFTNSQDSGIDNVRGSNDLYY